MTFSAPCILCTGTIRVCERVSQDGQGCQVHTYMVYSSNSCQKRMSRTRDDEEHWFFDGLGLLFSSFKR